MIIVTVLIYEKAQENQSEYTSFTEAFGVISLHNDQWGKIISSIFHSHCTVSNILNTIQITEAPYKMLTTV